MGDRHPLAYLSDIMAPMPTDGNLMINAIFLRGQTEAMKVALADKAELSPYELAQAAARLPRSTAVPPPAAVNAAPVAAPSSPVLEASAAPFAPRRPERPASRGRRSPASRRPPQARRRTPSPNRQRRPLPQPPPSSGLCFYHYHFDRDAHRCAAPCSWRPENLSPPRRSPAHRRRRPGLLSSTSRIAAPTPPTWSTQGPRSACYRTVRTSTLQDLKLLTQVVKKFHLGILYRKNCNLALTLLHKIFCKPK